jgi:hypothetical protein
VSVSERDRQEIVALGEDLPRLWHAATTTSGDHKQIVRLVIKEVTLDQKRRCGYVWIRIIWQTDAASEHWLQRCVQNHADGRFLSDPVSAGPISELKLAREVAILGAAHVPANDASYRKDRGTDSFACQPSRKRPISLYWINGKTA